MEVHITKNPQQQLRDQLRVLADGQLTEDEAFRGLTWLAGGEWNLILQQQVIMCRGGNKPRVRLYTVISKACQGCMLQKTVQLETSAT